MLLSQDGQPKAMLIGRVEETNLQMRLGYKTVFSPEVRLIAVVYGGFLGEQSCDMANAFISELMECLGRGEAEAVLFNQIKMDSEMFESLGRIPGFLSRDRGAHKNLHWKIPLPSSLEKIYERMSGKRRHELRRFQRALEKAYPGKVVFRRFERTEDVDELCRQAEAVASKTYQRGMGVGFVTDDMTRDRMALAAERGWLRGYILYLNDDPCSFWIGTLYKDIFYLDATGYDPAFKKYEIGTILLLRLLEDACSANAKEIDFGFGDAPYKQRFGSYCWDEATLYLFAPTLRGFALNIVRSICILLSRRAASFLGNTGNLARIKRRWRDRLAVQARR
jgi:CelD/BcsL family acetyltransferase involved in cellulose biosynthesis